MVEKKQYTLMLLMTVTVSIFSSIVIKAEAPAPEITEEINLEVSAVDNISDKTVFLPSTYSSLDYGYVTEVKDQNVFSCCWAFGITSVAETNLIKNNILEKEDADLAELHSMYFVYHHINDPLNLTGCDNTVSVEGDYLNKGGYSPNAILAWANWAGPVKEELMPYDTILGIYNKYGIQSALGKRYPKTLESSKDIAHLQNSKWIPMSDINGIKQAIMSYGSICSAYNTGDTDNYKRTNDYVSYNNMSKETVNHAIAIVGWDDNFSKDNFTIKPNNDGAWLIKNSWGTNAGKNGYYWISYECSSLYKTIGYTTSFESVNNYKYNYHYDGSYANKYTSYKTDEIYEANVFKSQGTENLEAVSFSSINSNYNYEISIYKGENLHENPSDGTLITNITGFERYSGIYTVKLKKTIPLNKGELFSIVVKYTGQNEEIVKSYVESTNSGEQFIINGKSNPGESFIGLDGDNWYDCQKTGNVRIKAYTNPQNKQNEIKQIEIDAKNANVEYKLGEPISIKDVIVNAVYNDKSKKDITSDCTFEIPQDIKTAGKYKIKVLYKDYTGYYNVIIKESQITDDNNQYKEDENPLQIENETDKNDTSSHNPITVTNLIINTDGVKKTYQEGESFDSNGIIVEAIFSNDTKKIVTNDCILSGYDTTKVGTQNVEVRYENISASYTIEINKKEVVNSITRIYVDSEQSKTVYYTGDILEPESLKVYAEYKNGEIKDVSNDVKTKGFDSSLLGSQILTIRYDGLVAAFRITMKLKAPQITKIKTGNKTISISWDKVEAATGYKLYFSTKKNGKYQCITTTRCKCYIIKDSEKKYYFKVKSYAKIGSTNVYSDYR